MLMQSVLQEAVGQSGGIKPVGQLHILLKSKPKQSVFSRKLSKGGTFSVEKPQKLWTMVDYFMSGYNKSVRLINVLRIELLLEK